MLKQFDSLFDLMEAFPDEQSAIDHFTAIRWKNGAYCPYCGSTKVYHFSDNRNHKCGDCRKRFSIKVGTIFGDTKIGLRKWFMAIWLITSHKKGVASTQLAKDIKVTQKTAWFMLHRLRHAARTASFNRPLGSDGEPVEADETFVGGKERNKHASKRQNKGRGAVGKTPIMGIKERGGEVRFEKAVALTGKAAKGMVRRNVMPGAVLITDEARAYQGLDGEFNHYTVNHSAGEYVRHFYFHTNSIESAWALLKRQIIGIHHWVSAKHLQRYLDEMMFRQNRREAEEGDRVNMLLDWAVEKRLTYKDLTA